MISFSLIYPSIVLATFIPAYLALYLVPALRRTPARYLAAAGVGLSFWYFFDTMGDAAALGENNSLYPPSLFGGLPHFALIGAFILGVASLALLDNRAVPRGGFSGGSLFLIPAAVALVMGIHGLGEGWDALSSISTGPPSTATGLQALIQAFGTFPALVSYPIHKFLEAAIVGVLYSTYVARGGASRRPWWEIPLLGVLFAGPSAVGGALGYSMSFDTTYFFAFGVTAAMYAVLRLAEAAARTSGSDAAPAHYGAKIFMSLAVGVLLLYTAALLH